MKKKSKIIIIFVVILSILLISILGIYFIFFSWGDEGKVILQHTSNKVIATLNESITVTITIENIGNTDVRILNVKSYFNSILTDINGTYIWTNTDEEFDRGPLTNGDLTTVKSGVSISRQFEFEINPNRFDRNTTYYLHAEYLGDPSDDGNIFLPFWKGTLQSNTTEIHIL